MPLFKRSKKASADLVQNPQLNDNQSPHPSPVGGNSPSATRPTPAPPTTATNGSAMSVPNNRDTPPPVPQQPPRPKLVFHCQQAQGSPTGIISGFTNVKELYQKIAECYDLEQSDILFCTLNTHKVDMNHLLGGQIGLEDFIFAHVKGQPKEVEITKSEDALGLTITDNGAGYAFIKRIKEHSIMDTVPLVAMGDHIEKINGTLLVGKRHFEVAKMLKEIPKGTTFTMRIVAPLKSGWSQIDPRSGSSGKKKAVNSGMKTLRMRKDGPATVEDVPAVDVESNKLAVDKINGLLESFMGINDTELSQSIWEIGCEKDNPHDFAMAVDESDLGNFGFTDGFIYDLWGAITDAKSGRLKKVQDFSEQF